MSKHGLAVCLWRTQAKPKSAVQGFTLKGLISMAFAVEDDAAGGGQKWLESDRFDVIAKAGTPAPDGMEGMLKTLIVQRFKLATHNDTQPLPVFALVLG